MSRSFKDSKDDYEDNYKVSKFIYKHTERPFITYIDTDSVFTSFRHEDDKTIDEIFSSEFNDVLRKEFINVYNPEFDPKFNLLELEYENYLDYYFSSGVKKRYYAIRKDGSIYIKGLSIIRKDTPSILKTELNTLANKTVRDIITYKDLQDVYDLILKSPLKEIGIVKAFSKPFNAYNKTMPQHVKAGMLANTFDGVNITSEDKPYMFFVKYKNPESGEFEKKEICLNPEHFYIFEKYSDIISMDYEEYFDRQVLEPFSEFIYSNKVKSIVLEYMNNHKDFDKYKKFFKRVKSVKSKLQQNKQLTVGIYEWAIIWDSQFNFSENYDLIENKDKILKV